MLEKLSSSAMSRRGLLFGSAALGLAACSGGGLTPRQTSSSSSTSKQELFAQMRQVGINGFYDPNAHATVVLPEYANTLFSGYPGVSAPPNSAPGGAGGVAPQGCVDTPLTGTKRVDFTLCGSPQPSPSPVPLPVIATVVAHCGCGTLTVNAGNQGSNWYMNGTFLAGGIGGPFAGAIYAWTMSSSACRTELLASTGAGLTTIAGAINYAQSNYAKELSQGASWYLSGALQRVNLSPFS